MAKFFNDIIAPQLDSVEYGQGIQNMVDNINHNFQKVFTLPFLKGDDGDMISTEFCYFWSKNENEEDILTEEGVKIFNTIFDTTVFVKDMTYENFKEKLCQGDENLNLFSTDKEYNNISLFEELYAPNKSPKILLFYKISSEDGISQNPLGSAQLYYFFDPRIDKLNNLLTINTTDVDNNKYKETFKDYTCILSTKYIDNGLENIQYIYEKQNGWPTLYFDNSSKQFCWQINGQKTGVNAQGVNGKDGTGARLWICNIEYDSNQTVGDYDKTGIMSKFIITKVFVPYLYSWEIPGDDLKSRIGEINYFQQGDMAVCYLPNDNNNLFTYKDENGDDITINYPDQMIGIINQESSTKDFFIQASLSQNTSNTFKNISLFNLLNNIGKTTNLYENSPLLKGLFIPTDRGENKSIHALFEGNFNNDSNSGLYLVKTNSDDIKTTGNKIAVENNGDNFNIYYNTNIYGNTLLNCNKDCNTTIFSNKKGQLHVGDSQKYDNGRPDGTSTEKITLDYLLHIGGDPSSFDSGIPEGMYINRYAILVKQWTDNNGLSLYLNPDGGDVNIGSGGLNVVGHTTLNSGLLAYTSKDTSSRNNKSNVLIGINDPGNEGLDEWSKDFPNTINDISDKGGYPLVIRSYNKTGSDLTDSAMVFGTGDIYALTKDSSGNIVPGTLCLQDRAGYMGDVLIGRNLQVGDNSGNLTVNGDLNITNDAEISGKVNINNDTCINTNLIVNNNEIIDNDLYVGGNVNISNELSVQTINCDLIYTNYINTGDIISKNIKTTNIIADNFTNNNNSIIIDSSEEEINSGDDIMKYLGKYWGTITKYNKVGIIFNDKISNTGQNTAANNDWSGTDKERTREIKQTHKIYLIETKSSNDLTITIPKLNFKGIANFTNNSAYDRDLTCKVTITNIKYYLTSDNGSIDITNKNLSTSASDTAYNKGVSKEISVEYNFDEITYVVKNIENKTTYYLNIDVTYNITFTNDKKIYNKNKILNSFDSKILKTTTQSIISATQEYLINSETETQTIIAPFGFISGNKINNVFGIVLCGTEYHMFLTTDVDGTPKCQLKEISSLF